MTRESSGIPGTGPFCKTIFKTIEKMIADMLKENLSARVKVKDPDGKIIDIIT